jgi:hypothetical protein
MRRHGRRKDGNRGKESESLLRKKIGYKFPNGPGKFEGIGCKVRYSECYFFSS